MELLEGAFIEGTMIAVEFIATILLLFNLFTDKVINTNSTVFKVYNVQSLIIKK